VKAYIIDGRGNNRQIVDEHGKVLHEVEFGHGGARGANYDQAEEEAITILLQWAHVNGYEVEE
jgi:hypothetical protein